MVICAAYGCSSRSGRDKVSFLQFPRDVKRQKIWIDRLKRGEVGSRNKPYIVKGYSRLCSLHFTPDQFETKNPEFAKTIGYTHKVYTKLKPDAVPSIFPIEAGSSTVSHPLRQSAENIRVKKLKQKIRTTSTVAFEDEMVDTSPEYFATPLITTATVPTTTATTTFARNQASTATTTSSSLDWFADISLSTQRVNPCTSTGSYAVQTQTPYNLVARRNVAVQCGPSTSDMSTQTEPCETLQIPACIPQIDSSLDLTINESRDMEWTPDSESESDDGSENGTDNEAKEEKFIVFKSCLEKLLDKCDLCGQNCLLDRKTIGTGIIYKRNCLECGKVSEWSSQPFSGTMPFGNLIVCAAIMFSGVSPIQALRLLDFAGVASVSKSTYMNIQAAYLSPAVRSVWQQKQASLLSSLRRNGQPLKLGGDGRCCSPGHTAKFGSYSLMDLQQGCIVDIQLVQSNEVANSYGMEKEGLARSLSFLLKENNLAISDLVTDRHSAIKKFIREGFPEIHHWFDVWHVAKGIHKKLVAAGKKKGCVKVAAWARSVSNHLYWCAASSEGDGELMREKWLSILNHVANIHEGHGITFPKCAHEQLQEDRDWMIKGRKPHAELERIVTASHLMKDIGKLSPGEQTSSLEAFHKVICAFAPKSVHFFHAQMEARLYLAGLHFNENQGRSQRQNRRGESLYSVSFPKARHGEGVAKHIKTDMTFQYIQDLMNEVIFLREVNCSYASAYRARQMEEPERPLPLAQSTPRANKADIVQNHRRRFNR